MRSSHLAALTVSMVACSGGDTGIQSKAEILVGDAAIRLDEDGSAPVVLTAESSDGGEVSYEIVTQPSLGELVGDGAQWEYVADPDVNGQDSFTWKALGDGVESEVATVTVFIDPVNDAPTGQALQLGTPEDTPVSDRLNAVDVEGDALNWTLVSAPGNGRLDLDSATGEFTYTPHLDFTGADSFVWSASDTAGASTGPVTVEVSVVEGNDPPTAQANSYVLAEDGRVDAELVGSDPDGDPLTWRIDDDVDHGTLDLNTNLGTFTYTPAADYFGPDSFTVVASDGVSDSIAARIDLVVTGVNDAPVVPSSILEVDEDSVLSAAVAATDVEGDALSFRVDVPVRNGVLAVDPSTGQLTYTPNQNWHGVDDFTVVVSDPFADSIPTRVTLVVQPVNDPPTVSGGALLLTDEDTAVGGAIQGADPEGDPLTFVVSTAPQHGTLNLSAAVGDFVYTPGSDFSGNDLFAIQASDGQATSGAAVVTVQVLSVNDKPRLTPVSLTLVEDTSASVGLPAVDPEGDVLYFLLKTAPGSGTASVDSLTGLLEYEPDSNFYGNDVLVYTVSDGQSSSDGFLPITVLRDTDADTVEDTADNCVDDANSDQRDANLNGAGDACDCWSDAFSATLDPDLWAASSGATPTTTRSASPSHSVALTGPGAYLQTVALPGWCAAHLWDLEVNLGSPPPEATDVLVLSGRSDGGPWVTLQEVYGTGADVSFQPMSGTTEGLALDGAMVEFRIEVFADEVDDVFTIDDFALSCDTDADWLPDCVETWAPGYDLTIADGDGDGWLDGDEYAAGSDPWLADTDFDGVIDPVDNCPSDFNPTQEDADGNKFGDACDPAIHDDFDLGFVDPEIWASSTLATVVSTPSHSAPHSLRMQGLDNYLEAHPMDFGSCPSVAWNFRLQLGTSTGTSADTTDHLFIEYWNGTAWVTLADYIGGTHVASFAKKHGSTTNPLVLADGARIRLHSDCSIVDDNFYVDNFVMGCDQDLDGLPNWAEINDHGTDPTVADTDGDLVNDGAEVLAGTDPLVP